MKRPFRMTNPRQLSPTLPCRHGIAGAASLIFAFLLSGCEQRHTVSVETLVRAQQSLLHDRNLDPSATCVIRPYPKFPGALAGSALYVPVTINGVESAGVFDTGAEFSLVTPELATAAKLTSTGRTEFMRGVTGSFKVQAATAHTVGVGSARLTGNVPVQIWKFPRSKGTVLGMQIGLDFIEQFDWDIDLPHKTLRPYDISRCGTIEPPWRTSSSGIPLTSAFAAYHRKGWPIGPSQVTVPVIFPGGTLDAVVDTGAMKTMLSYQAARDVGVTGAQLKTDPTHTVVGLSGDKLGYYIHKFPDIAIGEDELHDMRMAVAPGFDRRDDPMILGMDYIGSHHIWLSFATGGLYIDSGSPRRPGPPLELAHQVAGLSEPLYPPSAKDQTASVNAECMVETDGAMTGCHITGGTGNKLFESAAMDWLTGDSPPIMQPAYVQGKPVRQNFKWSLDFVPKAEGGKIYALPPEAK